MMSKIRMLDMTCCLISVLLALMLTVSVAQMGRSELGGQATAEPRALARNSVQISPLDLHPIDGIT